MPQLFLPGFPEGTSSINATVNVLRREGWRAWFAWGTEIFAHPEGNRGSFKSIVSALIRESFVSSTGLISSETSQTLTVRIHRMACPAHDQTVTALLKNLTNTEYKHPQTQAKMIFELV